VVARDVDLVVGGIDAVAEDCFVDGDADEGPLDAGEAEALIFELTAIDMDAGEGADRGDSGEVSLSAGQELEDGFARVGAAFRPCAVLTSLASDSGGTWGGLKWRSFGM
jgi:hypothetical protein